jgi:hypothetical protein
MPTYTFNSINYEYTVGSGTATVITSSGVSGDLTFLPSFVIDSETFNVNNINPYAFNNVTAITSVTIPSFITTIGDYAFQGCTGLVKITLNKDLPNYATIFHQVNNVGLEVIFDYVGVASVAFKGRSNLTTVTIGPNITSIAATAFQSSGLVTVTTLGSITTIQTRAFENCQKLTSITIPPSCTTIADFAFQACSTLTSITLNAYVANFKNAFNNVNNVGMQITFNYTGAIFDGMCYNLNNLVSVTIGPNITSIGAEAFTNCSSLTSIIIPSSVTSIGNSAFNQTGILNVYFNGSSIPTIGTNNFNLTGDTAWYLPEVGSSDISRLSMFTNIYSVPTAPTITSVNGLSISFTQSVGASPSISNYSYSIDGTTYTALSPAQTSSPLTIPVTGLKFGSLYTYRIKAFNTVSTSTASNGIAKTMTTIVPCFKDDTKILTDKGYIQIKDLKNGDLIETFVHGLKPITAIGRKQVIHLATNDRNPEQLYKYTNDTHSSIFEDLIITGRHAILVDDFVSDEQRDNVSNFYKGVLKTDGKYLLPSSLDVTSNVYEVTGEYNVYHLALQNDDENKNYGIYANGLLVETASEGYLKNRSNMELIE